jgi:hypothetical protein
MTNRIEGPGSASDWAITGPQTCNCRRPQPTGRRYGSNDLCHCGAFIVDPDRRARLRAEEHQRRIDWLKGQRSTPKGWIDPRGYGEKEATSDE